MRRDLVRSSLPWKQLFADLLVIVASVLIALAVDSWWDRHEERNRAEEYLKQLLVDFKRTDSQIKGAIAAEKDRIEGVNRVIGFAQHGPLPHPDSLQLPTGYNYFEPLTGTLTALVQGGDLRLLPNDSLRFELIAFSALLDQTQTSLGHTETLIWNSTEHVILGRARHSHSAERRAGTSWGEVDVASVLNDPEIIAALQVQLTASGVRIFSLGRLEKPIRRIIQLIEEELN